MAVAAAIAARHHDELKRPGRLVKSACRRLFQGLWLYLALFRHAGCRLNTSLDHSRCNLQSIVHKVDTGFIGKMNFYQWLGITVCALQDNVAVSNIDYF